MELLQLVAVSLGMIVATTGLIGLAVRMVLVPYLRTNLIEPMLTKFGDLENSLADTDASHTRVLARIQWELSHLETRIEKVEKKVGL